jgi:hypothetical protein
MNGIKIRIEHADYVGQVEAELVTRTEAGTIFVSGETIIIAQAGQCLVVTQ